MSRICIGSCVRIPDGRVGRVRQKIGCRYKVRVQRRTSKTHQFLSFDAKELHPIVCPKGWMTPRGYNRYLKITLLKMKQRQKMKRH